MTTNQTKAVLNMACDNIFDINYISKYYNNLGEKKLFKNFIKEFNSIKEASEEIGISKPAIVHCLKGKTKKAGGYKWKYKYE